ncbi:MAG: hypothetical protein V4726_06625 [Verrucomicrobiota bacterium]
MPAISNVYQAADAALLQPVASMANGDVGSITFIPGGWTVIQTLSDASSGVQAILAVTTLPSTGDTVAVLALGQLWPGILRFFSGGPNQYGLTALNANVSGQPASPVTPATPLFSGAYQTRYVSNAEPLIFKALSQPAIAAQVTGLPLIVIGQAVGAPLAQLAAMAFRQTRSGIPANIHTAACYTFSTPPMGDVNFAALLVSTIPASFNVYADNVDFFASPPVPFPGAVRSGVPQALAAAIPTVPELNNAQVDDPWREHSGAYYTGLLTTPAGSPTTPGTVTAPPSTFSTDLAQTLTQMTAVAYQQTQHPNSTVSPPVSGYTLNSFLSSGGTRWGAIFTDAPNQRVFVIFRGEICFEETVSALTQQGIVYPAYLPSPAALAPGLDQIYSGLRPALRSQAAAALTAVGGTNIIVAGHGVGGALANIAALDFASQGGGFSAPSAVYTFGSPPSGDPSFQSSFNTQFGTAGATPSSFQVTRPGDPFPSLMAISGGPMTVGLKLTLNGATPYDDNIYHSLTSFLALLNPN